MRLAQLDRAFGYGPKGRGFESSSARYEGLEKTSPFDCTFVEKAKLSGLQFGQNYIMI